MRVREFKERVVGAFGERLEHATPANVREFLDSLQQEAWRAQRSEQSRREGRADPPYAIPPTAGDTTWEALVRSFFMQTLDMDQEQALIMLWVFGLDLAYSGIEELHADSLNPLFRDLRE